MTELFTPAAEPDQGSVDPIEIVKQKFSRDGEIDVEALLKAKAESDAFIKRLEGEQAGVREEMNKRASFDELIAKIDAMGAQRAESANHAPDAGQGNEQHKPETSVDDIRKMVSESFNQEQTKAAQAKNVDDVKKALENTWGTNFADKLKQLCNDLELSQEEAGFMAATRPKAFLKLVLGDKTPAVQGYAPPQSSYRTEAVAKPMGDRTYSHYRNMMSSSDPKVRAEYWSPRVQNKIHQLALELGDAFLNS